MLAILTADMEGFSGRMRSDETAVISLLVTTYYRLAREAATGHGGQLFRREGDAIWCTFPQADSAIEAGLWLLAKIELYNRGRPHEDQVRLRVGLAWGEVDYVSAEPGCDPEPFGPTVDLAKHLESGGLVGALHAARELLRGRPMKSHGRREFAGHGELETAFLWPSEALLRELDQGLESAARWVLALDLSQVSDPDRLDWLAWAVEARQHEQALVLEWKEHHHLVVWPGPMGQLPFALPARGRCALTQGPVMLSTAEGQELSWSGAAIENAMALLEQAPDCGGVWADESAANSLAWTAHSGQLHYQGPHPDQGLQLATPGSPAADQLLERLAAGFAHQQAACILCGPLASQAQVEGLGDLVQVWENPTRAKALAALWDLRATDGLMQLQAPIFSWFDDPRLSWSKVLLSSPETAWSQVAGHTQWQPLLRRGELLWLAPPGSQEGLKLLYADFDYRFQNPRPGVLLHWGWPERDTRRWARRGFDLVEFSPDFFEQLGQRFRFLSQQRLEQRRLSALPTRPYKFLHYYTREDRAIFFGRDQETERLQSRLISSSLLVVFGKSGVGKTSLLRAGLLSRFQAPRDLVVSLRMLSEPVASLRALLCRTLGLKDQRQSLASLLETAEGCVRGRVIVVLDQFEEFFLRCNPAQRTQFAEQVADLLSLDLRRTHLVLSLREDFLAQMSELETILPNILQQRFRVIALDRQQALAAILKPAKLFHLEIDPAVVDELMNLLDQGGIEPPQLQIILDRLYDNREPAPSGTRIRWEKYQQLGGAERLLRGYFEDTLQHSLGPETQRARQLLKCMITPSKTRQVVTLAELGQALSWPQENLASVLKLLVESRLVRGWDEERHGCYELAHDFLTQEIASWETPQEVAAKHAQAVLRNEMRNYNKLGLVMSTDRLSLLHQQAEHLTVGAMERAMLVRSSVLRGLDPTIWMADGQPIEVLLKVLDEAVSGAVSRSVIAHLCQHRLEERALTRMLQAVREVGNPHLLQQLTEVTPALREALNKAVHDRFFGPQSMVLVPAGPAWVGSTQQSKQERKARLRADLHERIGSEADYHQVDIEAFRVDLRQVCNADYCEFRPLHVHFFPPEEAQLPAVNVSCEEAQEYAAWLGKRLPSEEQWEKAARGSDGRLFPWGNEFDSARVNSAESGRRTLTPVDAFPEGASPYGCLNMAGNVWEWTSTPWEPDSPLMAKKGGCALNFEPHMHCSARFEDPPEMRLRWASFRLISPE
ncbi:SUMF1/EgtB/PvdO family nonheme iron enzyme [bacterium]|nr:SUMF1/EgtB/PvdO family nonheme iron enzyme [bacterium]